MEIFQSHFNKRLTGPGQVLIKADVLNRAAGGPVDILDKHQECSTLGFRN